MKIALIVDRDLGLMFWLAEILVKAGYTVYPASTVADARHLIGERGGEVALALVNPGVPQAAGLLTSLSECAPPPSIVTLAPNACEPLFGLLELLHTKPCHAA